MAKICMECFEIYRGNFILYNGRYNFCPKIDCHGEVVEVDELILPTIIELNKKKYFTEFCCSGHFYDRDSSTYIKFRKGIKLPIIPKGFIVESNLDNEGITIRKRCKTNNFKKLCKTSIDLLNWTKDLD